MTLHVSGAWHGWKGKTVVKLTDGSIWVQTEYHYEYRYAYRPEVLLSGGELFVAGMSKPVGVRRGTKPDLEL